MSRGCCSTAIFAWKIKKPVQAAVPGLQRPGHARPAVLRGAAAEPPAGAGALRRRGAHPRHAGGAAAAWRRRRRSNMRCACRVPARRLAQRAAGGRQAAARAPGPAGAAPGRLPCRGRGGRGRIRPGARPATIAGDSLRALEGLAQHGAAAADCDALRTWLQAQAASPAAGCGSSGACRPRARVPRRPAPGQCRAAGGRGHGLRLPGVRPRAALDRRLQRHRLPGHGPAGPRPRRPRLPLPECLPRRQRRPRRRAGAALVSRLPRAGAGAGGAHPQRAGRRSRRARTTWRWRCGWPAPATRVCSSRTASPARARAGWRSGCCSRRRRSGCARMSNASGCSGCARWRLRHRACRAASTASDATRRTYARLRELARAGAERPASA